VAIALQLRRELRGAELLRRQDPARAADRGRDPPPGRARSST
jgi:hypothetical protein